MEMNPATLRIPQGADGADEGDDLRTLEWSALLARLAAERDLRREFAAGREACRAAADFVNGAALVAGDSSHAAPTVNPDTLANLKSTGSIEVAARANMPVARLGARGKQ